MKRKQLTAMCLAGLLAIGLITGCGERRKADALAEENKKEESDGIADQSKKTPTETDSEEEQQEGTEESNTAEAESEQEESAQEQGSAFRITEKKYTDGDIQISYPYIENLVNQQITDFYNHEFESTVAAYAGESEEGDLASGSQQAVQSYTVTYQSDDMVSILIDGNFYSDGMPHPYSYSLSYNINLITGASMSITDTFTPEEIMDDIMAFRYITVMGNQENEYIKQELEMKGKEEILNQLNHCDYNFTVGKDGSIADNGESPYSYSYRQEDGKWLIALEGSHAIGDYFTLRYEKSGMEK